MAGASLTVFAVFRKYAATKRSGSSCRFALIIVHPCRTADISKAIVAIRHHRNLAIPNAMRVNVTRFSRETELERERENRREEKLRKEKRQKKMNRRIEFLSCVPRGVSCSSPDFGRGSSNVACFHSDCGVHSYMYPPLYASILRVTLI